MDASPGKYTEMESSVTKGETEMPKDTYRVAYIIHFLLGAGSLLPWNAVITAVDYFGYCYPASLHVEKVFSVGYMASSLATLVAMLVGFGTSHSGLAQRFRVRTNMGFSMFVLSLMLTPAMDWWLQEKKGPSAGKCATPYPAAVAAVVVCGLGDGLVGGALFGSAGKLPKEYMQAIFAGTASSGVFISTLRLITKASLPQTPEGLKTSAHLYFIVSTAILLLCIASSNLLYKLPVMNHHHGPAPAGGDKTQRFWVVARAVRWPAFGVFMIYTVTLSIFPGFLAENIRSGTLKDWYPILLITLYNVSDFLGKSATGVYVVKSIGKATWGCVGRILLYPFFSLCLHGPRWLKTETPIIFLTVTLGITNGYLTSVLMILSPKTVPVSESETAAIVMAVFLGLGLVSGSVLGWVWII